jgi:hypothetical protein
MKTLKYTIATIFIALVVYSNTAKAEVQAHHQTAISNIVAGAGMNSMWAQDISFWIENPGFTKYELEGIGHTLCSESKKAGIGFYIITFWHQFGSGKITKVACK